MKVKGVLLIGVLLIFSWINGGEIKYPNVAGSFYTDNAKLLNKTVSEFINNAKVSLPDNMVVGIISPHAGYIYSGETAGYSFKALKTNNFAKYKRIFILGPSHYFRFKGLALPDFSYYRIPTGNMVIDESTVKKLSKNKYFQIKNTYFMKEHSVEVELPFINYVFPGVKIIPIVVGYVDKEMIPEIVKMLKPYLRDSLFVISSDLMHYKPEKVVQQKDKEILNLIISKKADTVLKKDLAGEVEACGIFPIYVFLNLIKDNDEIKGKILHMADSGKTTNNFNSVVGYGAVVFYKPLKKK